ncbi:two-partner secretion domain-containing protein [Baaleninema simplex]|uniref:two-partner secretion domain-containing protein n=1 Tax=Baaleninema simplex TaxID=2862350 RepID=UPI00036A1E10|nr:filamentous hemagglutinin N-terminal domain-containing protein [Baaleninema simplex]
MTQKTDTNRAHTTVAISSVWGWIGSVVLIGVAIAPPEASAQRIPDTSLPNNSYLETSEGIHRITGGTEAGSNLFHSFQEFNVDRGEIVRFENAQTIHNIITRVTGENPSRIDGVLGANGAANLFLLNPNGIAFGPNARLDLGGSFVASTGRFLIFDDRQTFDTQASQPLLSVNTPLGLQLDPHAGNVTSTGASLSVPRGERLVLAGGNLAIDGGRLEAPEGSVALLARSGRWTGDDPLAAFEGNGGAIALTNGAIVDTSGDRGGRVVLSSRELQLSGGARIFAETLGSENGLGIEIAVDRLEMRDDSLISTTTYGSGRGGDVRLDAHSIDVQGVRDLQEILARLFTLDRIESPDDFGGGLFATTFSDGNAGNISIDTDTLSLSHGAFVSTNTSGSGRGGTLEIRAGEYVDLRGAQIVAETFDNGHAGSVNFSTGNLRISEGGGIFASTFSNGDGGRVTVRASGTVEISGTTPNGRFNSAIAGNAFSNATTQAGLIDVSARRIAVRDGGGIGAVTFGDARGGLVRITASESIEVSGVRPDPLTRANINTRSVGRGAAGDITISTGWLLVSGGAEITTSTSNLGTAGRLTVRASEGVEIRGADSTGQAISRIRSDATAIAPFAPVVTPNLTGALGAAGDLTIVAPLLELDDGGSLVVSSLGEGVRAGNVTLDVDRLVLSRGAQVVAESEFAREGNVNIDARIVELRDNSRISTTATGREPGGNIAIATDTLVALENSDIAANATNSQGGRIFIRAQGIFGTAFRDRPTPNSDITATSALGAEFKGIVEIETPTLDAELGSFDLSREMVDLTGLVVDRCRALRAGSEFAVTGRGGLPPNPFQPVVSVGVWRDWRAIASGDAESDLPEHLSFEAEPMVEATTWQRHDDGSVSLLSPQARPFQTEHRDRCRMRSRD